MIEEVESFLISFILETCEQNVQMSIFFNLI